MSTDKLNWEQEALALLNKAPFFIRKLAKNKIEKAAIEQGLETISAEFVESIRQKS